MTREGFAGTSGDAFNGCAVNTRRADTHHEASRRSQCCMQIRTTFEEALSRLRKGQVDLPERFSDFSSV
jgi:hypothetical protein